jgi:hypothetical protein
MVATADDLDQLRRLARWSAALAIVLSVPSTLALLAAWQWNVEAMVFGDPATVLAGGPSSAALLRWGAYIDMFYSYLLLAPLALFLHRRLHPVKPWLAEIGTLCAFAYIFVGAAGAAIVGTVGPTLVEAYATAPPAEQPAITRSFGILRDITFGLWQVLDPITAGTWILSTGWLLLPERRLLARFLLVLACGLFAFGITSMFGIHSLGVLLSTVAAVVLLWIAWVVTDRWTRPSSSR